MKTCHKCNKEKALEEFPKNSSRKDGRSETCLECKREYNRQHYKNNKRYYVDKSNSRVDKLRDWLFLYKWKRGCKLCPENHPACLQFHHRNRDEKVCEVSKILGAQKSMALVMEEIKKCDLLCANCHAKLHCQRQLPFECDGGTQVSEA